MGSTRLITVHCFDVEDIGANGEAGSLNQAILYLESCRNQIPVEFRESASLDFEPCGGDNYGSAHFSVYYRRPVTPAELAIEDRMREDQRRSRESSLAIRIASARLELAQLEEEAARAAKTARDSAVVQALMRESGAALERIAVKRLGALGKRRLDESDSALVNRVIYELKIYETNKDLP